MPERKDRHGDNHGGVLIYVKNVLCYRRRPDLEPNGIECNWIEIRLTCKNILFGVYHRPPNTNTAKHALIEDSINLACDSNVDNVIITGDFNLNMNVTASKNKIDA